MDVKSIGFLGYLKYTFLILFIILFLLHVVNDCVKEKSFSPIITDLGKYFLTMTQNLDNYSKQILEQGVVFNPGDNFLSGLWNLLVVFSNFFLGFYSIYLWLVVLTKGFAFLFFSGDRGLGAFVLAFLFFVGIQSILLISINGINHNIDCFSGCEKSVVYYLSLPILCFIDFLRVILLFTGLTDKIPF